MILNELNIIFAILFIGILVSSSYWVRIFFKKIGLPPVSGYIILGVILSISEDCCNVNLEGANAVLYFLGELGVVTLLFRAGLECSLDALIKELKSASYLAFVNIIVSGVAGFSTLYYLLDFPLIPSLIVGVALTATSIGVTVMTWQAAGKLRTRSGQLLVNMTTLDDIVAIALMGILFTLVPVLQRGDLSAIALPLVTTASIFTAKLVIFVAGCFLFSYFMETRLMKHIRHWEKLSDPMLMIISTGFIIAAIAGMFGFSLAIGAFFAGISFSRDPKKSQEEDSIKLLEHFFMPFFFIAIGMEMHLGILGANIDLTVLIILVAVIGKIVGTFVPAILMGIKFPYASILGISMVPRAEIALVIVAKAARLGDWAMPPEVYSSMVVLSLFTCIGTPFVLQGLFVRYFPKKENR